MQRAHAQSTPHTPSAPPKAHRTPLVVARANLNGAMRMRAPLGAARMPQVGFYARAAPSGVLRTRAPLGDLCTPTSGALHTLSLLRFTFHFVLHVALHVRTLREWLSFQMYKIASLKKERGEKE